MTAKIIRFPTRETRFEEDDHAMGPDCTVQSTVVVPIPIPGYMQRKGQLGLAYLDVSTGTSWLYHHGYYGGNWSFHMPKDEHDAYYGTADAYVPKHVREAAAPIIAAFPPFHPRSYDEEYV